MVITSLIGTRGLELDTIEAIAKVRRAEGLVAGLASVALAIMIDRILKRLPKQLTGKNYAGQGSLHENLQSRGHRAHEARCELVPGGELVPTIGPPDG